MSDLQIEIGNIFKKDGCLYVVTAVDYKNENCTLLAFDSNVLEGAPFVPKTEKHICYCTYNEEYDEFCIVCGGNGYYLTESTVSMKDFVFVARTIRNYLIKKFID